MGIHNMNQTGVVSGLTNVRIDSNPSDILAYAQTLLVADYNDQMKAYAKDIKSSIQLKEAYRQHKIQINNLLSKDQDKDGQVSLNANEYNLLNSKPNFRLDPDNESGNPVVSYSSDGQEIDHVSNQEYLAAGQAGGPPIAGGLEADWHGDPHFNDARSAPTGYNHSDWDFQGVAGHTYTYLDDRNMSLTATHKAWPGGGPAATVVGSVDLNLIGKNDNTEIHMVAGETPLINGNAMVVGQVYQAADGGHAVYQGDTLQVTSAEGYHIQIDCERDGNGAYLNGKVVSPKQGVNTDGYGATGLIGNQFDGAKTASLVDGEQFDVSAGIQAGLPASSSTKKVKVEVIKTELERLQMRLDGLNSDSEMNQVNLSTITNQRKLAFETMSATLSKAFEASGDIIRNLK